MGLEIELALKATALMVDREQGETQVMLVAQESLEMFKLNLGALFPATCNQKDRIQELLDQEKDQVVMATRGKLHLELEVRVDLEGHQLTNRQSEIILLEVTILTREYHLARLD